MLVLQINDCYCSNSPFNSTPAGVENQGSFTWISYPDLIMTFHGDLSVFDHLWRCVSWCLDECIPALLFPCQSVPGCAARHPSVLHACASVGDHSGPISLVSSPSSQYCCGTASFGPVPSHRAVSLTIRFMCNAIDGSCNSVFNVCRCSFECSTHQARGPLPDVYERLAHCASLRLTDENRLIQC